MSATTADVRKTLGLEPNPALDAPIIAPPSRYEYTPALAVKAIQQVRKSMPSMPCEGCGRGVPIEFAIAGLASEDRAVVCDNCRLQIALRARESLLTNRQHTIRETYRRIGKNYSAIARELRSQGIKVSRFTVRRELNEIERIIDG